MTRRSRASNDPTAQVNEDGLRILVVEDNADAAEMLGELLGLSGHTVQLASDGTMALTTARSFQPHVVISDIGLPGGFDGYALAQALRSDSALSGAYLIALSGYSTEEARERSRAAGYDTHLIKPPDLAALGRVLDGVARK